MALGHFDYYVLKPWKTPDELFHRTVCEFLHEWRRQNATETPHEVTLVADPWSPRGYEIRNLLVRNGVPHVFHSTDSDDGRDAAPNVGQPGSVRARSSSFSAARCSSTVEGEVAQRVRRATTSTSRGSSTS